ncbi:hypothetical protein BKA62DRAFT_680995 [Auriculariales sp. MPI-PUGE-AT-0066]|nr:hypothetical protein BKA62DRAFT_680995 [Auriculariales sp. MPI-PUGE-AT-0066]
MSSLHQEAALSARPRARHAPSGSIASTGSFATSASSSISTPSQSSNSNASADMSPPPPLGSPSSASLVMPSTGGTRLKRALAGARKKVTRKPTQDDGMTSADESSTPLSVTQRAAKWGTQVRTNKAPPLTRLGNLGNAVFGRGKSKDRTTTPSSPPPPTPPPKPDHLRAYTNFSPDSPIVTSPSISAALMYMDHGGDHDHATEERDEITPTNSLLRRIRTADSTSGSRRTSVAATIRPVSGAPSIATITDQPTLLLIPVIMKTRICRAPPQATTPHVDPRSYSTDSVDSHHRRHPAQHVDSRLRQLGTADLPFTAPPPPSSFSPTPSPAKQNKRRSMSLDLTQLSLAHKLANSWPGHSQAQRSPPAALAATPASVSSASLVSREDARGIIGGHHGPPGPAPGYTSDTGSLSFRDRLTALNLANPSLHPPTPPSHPLGAPVAKAFRRRQPHFRLLPLQNARLPRVLGPQRLPRRASRWALASERTTALRNCGEAPTLARHHQPLPPHPRRNVRLVPRFFVGAWSVASLVMGAEDDGATLTPAGPDIGPCLRPPKTASGTGGLVFGRTLADCVRDTRAVPRVLIVSSGEDRAGPVADIEHRVLPVLIVRCVQHLRRWGVEEEGLFRISGRASHIARLRASFDTGADYDLREAGPGQLDPHAVSSTFKAFLRELPEPILTRQLGVKFDEVIASSPAAQAKQNHEFYGLPSGPAGTRVVPQMRKPPSLSDLGAATASPELLHRLSVLIARLPRENRDLLFTLIELLKTTAANVQSTKMPMANLLLLFCPSLQVSPSVLRLLCEAKGVWDGPLPAPPPPAEVEGSAPSSSGLPSPVAEEAPSFPTDPMPSPLYPRQVSGPGLAALEGGPRRRAPAMASAARSLVPGLSPADFPQEMFTVTPLPTPTPPAIVSSPNTYFHFQPPPSDTTSPRRDSPASGISFPHAQAQAQAPSPRTPSSPSVRSQTSSSVRSQEGTGESLKRRLSIFGLGGGKNSAGSSSGNVDEVVAPPSPSLRDRKRVVSRPSLQLMFSNRKSTADLVMTTPSESSRATPEPPVLSLPTGSPTFSVSMESFISTPNQHSRDGSGASSSAASLRADEPRQLGIPSSRNRSRSPSPSSRKPPPLLVPSSSGTVPRVVPLGTPIRSPSPGQVVALYGAPMSIDGAGETTPISPERPRTPIADMFRSPSRMATMDQDDDDEQILLLPPLAFSNSPMFKSPMAQTPTSAPSTSPANVRPGLYATLAAPAATSPLPRLDFQQQQAAEVEEDWERLVLSAARTSTDGRPPGMRTREQQQHARIAPYS